ncbi:MAG TPA: YetF domain-containing protein, partial [Flavitalea sp.]|nr:YetF domain-containing protein [Flavitalea sp.]
DFSITASLILISTLIGTDLCFSLIKQRFKKLEKITEGVPLIILKDGKVLEKQIKKARVQEGDILEAGRNMHGLERLDQMKYAVLEIDGTISIIPKEKQS